MYNIINLSKKYSGENKNLLHTSSTFNNSSIYALNIHELIHGANPVENYKNLLHIYKTNPSILPFIQVPGNSLPYYNFENMFPFGRNFLKLIVNVMQAHKISGDLKFSPIKSIILPYDTRKFVFDYLPEFIQILKCHYLADNESRSVIESLAKYPTLVDLDLGNCGNLVFDVKLLELEKLSLQGQSITINFENFPKLKSLNIKAQNIKLVGEASSLENLILEGSVTLENFISIGLSDLNITKNENDIFEDLCKYSAYIEKLKTDFDIRDYSLFRNLKELAVFDLPKNLPSGLEIFDLGILEFKNYDSFVELLRGKKVKNLIFSLRGYGIHNKIRIPEDIFISSLYIKDCPKVYLGSLSPEKKVNLTDCLGFTYNSLRVSKPSNIHVKFPLLHREDLIFEKGINLEIPDSAIYHDGETQTTIFSGDEIKNMLIDENFYCRKTNYINFVDCVIKDISNIFSIGIEFTTCDFPFMISLVGFDEVVFSECEIKTNFNLSVGGILFIRSTFIKGGNFNIEKKTPVHFHDSPKKTFMLTGELNHKNINKLNRGA